MIATVEEDEREPYARAICMVDDSGALDNAVVLRSMFQQRKGTIRLRAGEGIITDSQPPREYDKTTEAELMSTVEKINEYLKIVGAAPLADQPDTAQADDVGT